MSDVVGRYQLRASYVWDGEVMDDAVLTGDAPCTLGSSGDTTFVVSAKLGLPGGFAVLRPGARGWVLTLGAGMSGRVRIEGQEMEVADFLAREAGKVAAKGAFKAAGVGPGDWGVVHLDGAGAHTLFFQFVKADPPLPRTRWRDRELVLPALAFAVLLHGILLAAIFRIGDGRPQFAWPGDRELVADYILNRPPPRVLTPAQPRPGTEDGAEVEAASTAGAEARSGGEGATERKRAPDPDEGAPDEALPERVQTGFLSKRSRAALAKVRNRGGFDEAYGKTLARLTGATNKGGRGGSGPGRGTGVGVGAGTGTITKGTGKGTGGGGKAHADVRTQGKLDTGGKRAARGVRGGKGLAEVAVEMKTGDPSGDFGGLTHEQIMKVVRSRARAIQACYSRELQRSKDLGGKVVLHWKIDASGRVKGAKVRSTSLRNGRVEDCVVRQVSAMKFPSPKGGRTAVVNFPFIFAQQ